MKLTKAEEQLMKYLWNLERAFFKDLKEQYPEPKPATTTINTLLKRLIDKEVVGYKVYGSSREYYPLIEKDHYFSGHMRGLIKNHFNNSIEQFVSFFTREIDISEEDLIKLKDIVDQKIKAKSDD